MRRSVEENEERLDLFKAGMSIVQRAGYLIFTQRRISPAGIREFPGGPLDCGPVQRFTGLPQN